MLHAASTPARELASLCCDTRWDLSMRTEKSFGAPHGKCSEDQLFLLSPDDLLADAAEAVAAVRLDEHLSTPQRRVGPSLPAVSTSPPASSGSDSDSSSGSGLAPSKSKRRLSPRSICRSPEGPAKFASGAYKNVPAPTALPPPPLQLLQTLSPQIVRKARTIPMESAPPVAAPAPVPLDPAILAVGKVATVVSNPLTLPLSAAERCEMMSLQIRQMLHITA